MMRNMRLPIQPIVLLILSLFTLAACSRDAQPAPAPRASQIVNCSPRGEKQHIQTHTSALPTTEGDWPLLHGHLSRDGSAQTGGGGHLTLAWTYCTGAAISSSPIVHAGVVYIASTDTTFTALDIRTGKMLWNVQTDAAIYSTPVIQDGTVYLCSLDGTIYAVDARSGYAHWRAHVPTVGAKIWSSPAVAAGLLIVGVAEDRRPVARFRYTYGQVTLADVCAGRSCAWCGYMELASYRHCSSDRVCGYG